MYTALYRLAVRPFLFKMDPEDAHTKALALLEKVSRSKTLSALVTRLFAVQNKRLERNVMGITFPNPVGLAAGFLKEVVGLEALEAIGFGFLELGTFTPFPQEGNPRPRMFRLPEDLAIINRMGFNNTGAIAAGKALREGGVLKIPVGVSLGKGKETPIENAANDYCFGLAKLYSHADFFVLNVSSPNTPNLRLLQKKEALNGILQPVSERRKERCEKFGQPFKPILLKIAPDVLFEELKVISECVAKNGLNGLVVANTTVTRFGLKNQNRSEPGGLSGKPLFVRSLELVDKAKNLLPDLTIIGSGGIMNREDASNLLEAGADLIQIYTGLVYNGPGLIREINTELLRQ